MKYTYANTPGIWGSDVDYSTAKQLAEALMILASAKFPEVKFQINDMGLNRDLFESDLDYECHKLIHDEIKTWLNDNWFKAFDMIHA